MYILNVRLDLCSEGASRNKIRESLTKTIERKSDRKNGRREGHIISWRGSVHLLSARRGGLGRNWCDVQYF